MRERGAMGAAVRERCDGCGWGKAVKGQVEGHWQELKAGTSSRVGGQTQCPCSEARGCRLGANAPAPSTPLTSPTRRSGWALVSRELRQQGGGMENGWVEHG